MYSKNKGKMTVVLHWWRESASLCLLFKPIIYNVYYNEVGKNCNYRLNEISFQGQKGGVAKTQCHGWGLARFANPTHSQTRSNGVGGWGDRLECRGGMGGGKKNAKSTNNQGHLLRKPASGASITQINLTLLFKHPGGVNGGSRFHFIFALIAVPKNLIKSGITHLMTT